MSVALVCFSLRPVFRVPLKYSAGRKFINTWLPWVISEGPFLAFFLKRPHSYENFPYPCSVVYTPNPQKISDVLEVAVTLQIAYIYFVFTMMIYY